MQELEKTREMLKTRWPELDRSATDQGTGKPAPPMQKPCSSRKLVLPEPRAAVKTSLSLVDAIASRQSHRSFSDEELSIDELSYLLWATQGVRKVTPKASLRTVPSGGARHPLETYLFVSRVRGLESGLYRYLPLDHALCEERRMTDFEQQLDEALLKHHFGAALDFVWTAIPYRCEWSYSRESLRLILLDAGHVCAHLYLACQDVGCGTCAVGAYDQQKLDALVGVDGSSEFCVYAAPVGRPR
ncbi:MAG: SagB/ThcOx family dehydrogenase [Spirochaetaceae bacterium]|nr:MAG: SagB/ThcOx family dehydrogenase [Spirochaetaceae bacterium]